MTDTTERFNVQAFDPYAGPDEMPWVDTWHADGNEAQLEVMWILGGGDLGHPSGDTPVTVTMTTEYADANQQAAQGYTKIYKMRYPRNTDSSYPDVDIHLSYIGVPR